MLYFSCYCFQYIKSKLVALVLNYNMSKGFVKFNIAITLIISIIITVINNPNLFKGRRKG